MLVSLADAVHHRVKECLLAQERRVSYQIMDQKSSGTLITNSYTIATPMELVPVNPLTTPAPMDLTTTRIVPLTAPAPTDITEISSVGPLTTFDLSGIPITDLTTYKSVTYKMRDDLPGIKFTRDGHTEWTEHHAELL